MRFATTAGVITSKHFFRLKPAYVKIKMSCELGLEVTVKQTLDFYFKTLEEERLVVPMLFAKSFIDQWLTEGLEVEEAVSKTGGNGFLEEVEDPQSDGMKVFKGLLSLKVHKTAFEKGKKMLDRRFVIKSSIYKGSDVLDLKNLERFYGHADPYMTATGYIRDSKKIKDIIVKKRERSEEGKQDKRRFFDF